MAPSAEEWVTARPEEINERFTSNQMRSDTQVRNEGESGQFLLESFKNTISCQVQAVPTGTATSHNNFGPHPNISAACGPGYT